jgi:phytoene dehydrogenase-like protein
MERTAYDAVVVGAGPNGLSAAVLLARAGLSVCVLEANEEIGGGARTMALTQPGFRHDVCAAIHPMGVASPFFRQLPLEAFGLAWMHADLALAHPLDDGTAAVLATSVEETARSLGPDAASYRRLMQPLVDEAGLLFREILKPIRIPWHPLRMARFGLVALRSCEALVHARFAQAHARALVAGCAAHALVPLDRLGTASFGVVLLLAAHAAGWPVARGGSQAIVAALAGYLRHLGGEIRTGHVVRSLRDVPEARAVLLDLTPRQVLAVAGDDLPAGYRQRLARFRYGPGVFKVDWALDGPIPWTAEACRRAATVHVAGPYDEIAACEDGCWRGVHAERPFVLVAQQSLIDATRAPAGRHTGWAYCHVPHGSTVDMTEAIERQIERFAPGFRDRILARHTFDSAALEAHNANMIGGDIGGGANDLWQFIARPVLTRDPYATPNERLFLCSSSTPPGGGVHGMCGYRAAQTVLHRVFRKEMMRGTDRRADTERGRGGGNGGG